MHPTYYRGCWHVVSRCLFPGYRPHSSPGKGVYDPKAFFPHAVSLRQAFAHCARFPAAASRRSGGRVSVPLWPIMLSHRLPVLGLVGRYPSNYLIGRKSLPGHPGFHRSFPDLPCQQASVRGIIPPFDGLFPSQGQVTYALLSRSPLPFLPEGWKNRSTCMH